MQDENFIVREPLLNLQEEVIGYELCWQKNADTLERLSDADAQALAEFVSGLASAGDGGPLMGNHLVFIGASAATLKAGAYANLPPKGTVIAVHGDDLADPEVLPAIKALRAAGYGVSLRGAKLAAVDRSILTQLTHVETPLNVGNFVAHVQLYRSLDIASTRMVARGVASWEQYDVCAKLGIHAFVGKLHLTPRQGNGMKELNPAQTMILQLMDMVRQNADVRQLEGLLKRDAALSYKLLRYINSAGFGLGCEIQSLKHAVTMLGYTPLYRWLALLLATASTSSYSPVLMETAVIRGRFAELLGQTFLPKNEAENLFVAGMFSLLDKLFGVPMEDVLEKVQLSDAVSEALLTREGIYGPFLALAEACELNTAEVETMATSLCISPQQVNDAHLSALVWAQSIKL
jgi:EAL and modified HD-GYP domain-containing signal transduction protein